MASESKWREPVAWDRKAKEAGERHRVFCASLGDVFEDWPGSLVDAQGRVLHYNSVATWWIPEPTPHGPIRMKFVRERLFSLIQATPHLDWLLLTKRPENALRMMVESGLYAADNPDLPCPQRNLWIGTSVEDQTRAYERIPHLLRIPATVRFLSCEPLLGELNLDKWLWLPGGTIDTDLGPEGYDPSPSGDIDLIIGGGESGHGARPCHPDWARSLRDQCVAAEVCFFWKQWGEWMSIHDCQHLATRIDQGKVQVGEWHGDGPFTPGCICGSGHGTVVWVGKKAAGRLLDGRTWDELPTPALVR